MVAEEVSIRMIRKDDLQGVVEVHASAFPDSAITKLGSKIIERYYLWQLDGPHPKVLATGAFVGEQCAGFSFSGVFDGSVTGFLNHNKAFLAREVIRRPRLMLNPVFRKRLYSGVALLGRLWSRRSSKPASKPPAAPRERSFGILSIAVSRNHQKMGIGKLLMQDAEAEATKCGFERMHLTVSTENTQAVRFYEGLDWEKFPADEAWRGRMIKTLAPVASGTPV